jgi:hypothetical protein
MTDSFVFRFWARVQMQIFQLKISDSGLIEEMTLPNDQFNPNFIVNSLSIAITSQALNEATKTKAGELLPPSPIITTSPSAYLMNPELQAGTTYKSLKDRVLSDPTSTDTNQIVYMWVTTIDERTCPICIGLHGQTWDITEVDLIPNIPDDTHYNCRCRVMLVESQFAAQVAEQQATI